MTHEYVDRARSNAAMFIGMGVINAIQNVERGFRTGVNPFTGECVKFAKPPEFTELRDRLTGTEGALSAEDRRILEVFTAQILIEQFSGFTAMVTGEGFALAGVRWNATDPEGREYHESLYGISPSIEEVLEYVRSK